MDVSLTDNIMSLRSLTFTRDPVDLLTSVAEGSTDPYPAADLDILARALDTVSDMLDRVLSYVRSVLAGEVKGDAAVGRYLMNTFGASTEDLEKGSFNTSLQVCFPFNIYDCSSAKYAICAGHAHGLLPRKPRSITSTSFLSTCTHKGFLGVQKAMYHTFHRCIL